MLSYGETVLPSSISVPIFFLFFFLHLYCLDSQIFLSFFYVAAAVVVAAVLNYHLVQLSLPQLQVFLAGFSLSHCHFLRGIQFLYTFWFSNLFRVTIFLSFFLLLLL